MVPDTRDDTPALVCLLARNLGVTSQGHAPVDEGLRNESGGLETATPGLGIETQGLLLCRLRLDGNSTVFST